MQKDSTYVKHKARQNQDRLLQVRIRVTTGSGCWKGAQRKELLRTLAPNDSPSKSTRKHGPRVGRRCQYCLEQLEQGDRSSGRDSRLKGLSTNLNRAKITEIIQRIFSNHNRKKMRISNRKDSEKSTSMWKLKLLTSAMTQEAQYWVSPQNIQKH